MSQSDRYFQFPIGALRMNKSIAEVTDAEMEKRLSEIIDYCVLEVGRTIRESRPYEVWSGMAGSIARRHNLKFEKLTEVQLDILCGSNQLCVVHNLLSTTPSVVWKGVRENHKTIEKMSGVGGTQLCRLKGDYFWEAFKGKSDWNWRRLTTLCAVYAGIGSNLRTRLTYDRIGALAMGFNGQKARDRTKMKDKQLTDKQTLGTVKSLQKRGFFISASPNGRNVYYTNKMSLNELIEDLASTTGKAKSLPSSKSITAIIKERQAAIIAATSLNEPAYPMKAARI